MPAPSSKPKSTSAARTFAYRAYQIDDLARAAMHDGAVIAWDPGLGKTLALFTMPQLKGAKMILIVAPEGLHEQIRDEGREKFGITVRSLLSADDFYADATLRKAALQHRNGQEITTEGWWFTSYSALGYNGGDIWQPRETDSGAIILNTTILSRRQNHPLYVEELDFGIGQTGNSELTTRNSSDPHSAFPLPRCIFSPSLALLTANLFDCVECDEAVRIKADDSYTSLGVRTLNPRFRYVLTATPIKNKLDDIFWLCQWACCGGNREANARWPYENANAAKSRFADEHMLIEQNHTKEAEHAEKKGFYRRFTKRTPQICNIHRLWKLLGPVVLRRRKDDTGEDIVSKTIIPIRVMPGSAQQEVYKFHLANKPTIAKNGAPMNPIAQVVAQLQNLRQAALCPDTPNLSMSGISRCGLQKIIADERNQTARSWTDHNPKQAAILKLIQQLISKGEQVTVMSPFQEFSDSLYRRLVEAGVNVLLLDGKKTPKKRGALAKLFKRRRYSVLIGGIQSMGEGHSFECCSNLILPSIEWAYDKNRQSEDRVHRINSLKAVTIYTMITLNTIDERLASVYSEKGDSSNLALDGRLFADKTEEINLGQLLNDAIRNFNPDAPSIPEKDIELEWEGSLKAKLRVAQGQFNEWHPPIVPDIEGYRTTAKELADALVATDGIVTPTVKLVKGIPLATFAALAGTNDRTKAEQTQQEFTAFCAKQPQFTDWRMAWKNYEPLCRKLPSFRPERSELESRDLGERSPQPRTTREAAEDFFNNL